MSELIRGSDQVTARQYRNYAATTPASMLSGVQRLAELTKRYGERALQDDSRFFELLEQKRQIASKGRDVR